MSGGRRTVVPRWAVAPIVLNAIYYGFLSVALPIHLTQQMGFSKVEAALFFSVSAIAAMIVNLFLAPFVRRRGYPRWAMVSTCVLAALGLMGLAVSNQPSPFVYMSGIAIVVMTMVFPLYIGMVSRASRGDVSVIAAIRQVYVVAFMGGLGLFSLASFTGLPLMMVGVVVAFLALVTAIPRPKLDGGTRDEEIAKSAPRATYVSMSIGVLLTAVAAVLLMKAADALRGFYLPILAIETGLAEPLVSVLFLITAVLELLVLRPLGRAGHRIGTELALAGVAIAGAVSFIVPGLIHTHAALFVSQALYAVFAAGFQLLGMVQLGRLLPSGTEGGAALYTATIQLGTVVGAVAPLLAPGYSPTIFLIASALCGAAGLAMIIVWLSSQLKECGHPE